MIHKPHMKITKEEVQEKDEKEMSSFVSKSRKVRLRIEDVKDKGVYHS